MLQSWSIFYPCGVHLHDLTLIFESFLHSAGSRNAFIVVNKCVLSKYFRLPWGVIILIGGGFAMAQGTSESGLNNLIGKQLEHLSGLPDIGLLFIIVIIISVLTQIASNSATASMLLPIIRDLAIRLDVSFSFRLFTIFKDRTIIGTENI